MAKHAAKPPETVVRYAEPLVRSLEDSLRSAFRPDSHMRLSRRPGNHVPFFYVELIDTPATAELDGGQQQNVVEILTADGKPSAFYFGFQAVFNSDRTAKYLLHDASITVFHDVLGERIPVFRAEWHRNDASSATSNHTQPHWHFLQRPARIERIVLNAQRASSGEIMEFVPEEKTEVFSKLADCGKFHFAMTSLWAKRSDTHRVFDSDDFPEWFDGLTRHIADEIGYVVKKMPSTTKEFQPE